VPRERGGRSSAVVERGSGDRVSTPAPAAERRRARALAGVVEQLDRDHREGGDSRQYDEFHGDLLLGLENTMIALQQESFVALRHKSLNHCLIREYFQISAACSA